MTALAIVVGAASFTTSGLPAGAQVQPQSLDDRLADVARTVPGFGGLFVDDENGIVYVYLWYYNDAVVAATSDALAAAFPGRLPETTEVLLGQYGFLDLKEWSDRMAADVLAISGVVLTDIDEANNRLTVGVENLETAGPLVEEVLATLGIPREAVSIEETEPIKPLLRTFRRPVVGSLQIHFPPFLCTLGFNAIRAGVTGYVTNSHCTNVQGGVESTVHWQHLVGSTNGILNRIGVETVDPPYLPLVGVGCPAGRLCRWSDSSFARKDPGVPASLGRTARTALGSFAWNGTDLFRIVGETDFPLVGEGLTKIGRTTGRTTGPVAFTCVNTNVGGTIFTQLCQDFVTAGVAGGDSGSPVFRITNAPLANDVRLYGILWGSSGPFFVFSAIGPINIQRATEMGPLNTCAPPIVC